MKKLQNAIQKAKNALIKKAKDKNLYENFGQKEVRKLEDKFINSSDYTEDMNKKRDLLAHFGEWVSNYS